MEIDPVQCIILYKMLYIGGTVYDHVSLYLINRQKRFPVGNIPFQTEDALTKQLFVSISEIVHEQGFQMVLKCIPLDFPHKAGDFTFGFFQILPEYMDTEKSRGTRQDHIAQRFSFNVIDRGH